MMSDCEQSVFWRDDIDSLAFRIHTHEGLCVVHRRAFRALLDLDPTPQQCIDHFVQNRSVFMHAAHHKIGHAQIASKAHFHITSRDVRRHMLFSRLTI